MTDTSFTLKMPIHVPHPEGDAYSGVTICSDRFFAAETPKGPTIVNAPTIQEARRSLRIMNTSPDYVKPLTLNAPEGVRVLAEAVQLVVLDPNKDVVTSYPIAEPKEMASGVLRSGRAVIPFLLDLAGTTNEPVVVSRAVIGRCQLAKGGRRYNYSWPTPAA